jgi:hypothetical protein
MRWPAVVVFCALGALLALAASSVKERRGSFKVPLWVEPKAEKQELNLGPKDLNARLQGEPAKVLAVSRPGDDLMVLVVFDLTEHLELADKAKDALVEQIEQLPERSYVGLLRSQDGLKVLLDPTRDRAALAAAIRNVPVSGKAGLLESVETMETIADSILSKASIRVAVFYVTDSDVGNYREDFTNPVINWSDSHDLSRRFPEQLIQEKIAKMEARLAGSQAPLFIVHLNYRSDRLNEAYQNGLKRLAEVTGGSAVFCRSIAEIPDSIGKTLATIDSHYSVSLEAPERAGKSVEVQLELAKSGNGNGRNLTYRTRFVFK